PPIALDLFDQLEAFAQEVTSDAGTDIHRLTVFLENLFLQYFKQVAGVEITGVNRRAQRLSVRLRTRLPKAHHARQVLAQFEAICDDWAEVRGAGYVSAQEIRKEFYECRVTRDDEVLVNVVRNVGEL